MSNFVPTDAVSILSSVHGRQRRNERNISKRDLQAAVLYGEKEPAVSARGDKCWKYTFADIVYLTDETSTKEITSWPLQCCGIDVQKVKITPSMQEEHEKMLVKLDNKQNWTSHTVAVVDQSGSMRKADTSEGATRSDVVWLVLALEYVSKRIKSGEAKPTDVFTLIAMRARCDKMIKYKPMDWILYNELVEFLRTSQPIGDGNYLPSLDSAEAVLSLNQFSNCALVLIFLSDGRPSDRFSNVKAPLKKRMHGLDTMSRLEILTKERIKRLASRFGRRLTVGAIALGNQFTSESEFRVLRGISNTAKEYGCHSYFSEASLSVESLSKAFTYLSTTLTSTQTELTNLAGTKQRLVKNVTRETIKDLGAKTIGTDLWHCVTNKNTKYGNRNIIRSRWTKNGWKPIPDRYTFNSEKAVGIAVKKRVFGEGAERMVRELREIDANGKPTGLSLVAKESRFIEEGAQNAQDKKEFHKVFCKTQSMAQRFARVFNYRMKDRFGDNTPQIEFLECTVYMMKVPNEGRTGFLVEKMLNVKKFPYTKWNSNNGFVHGNSNVDESLSNAPNYNNILLHARSDGFLETVAEDEEIDSSESDDDSLENMYEIESDDSQEASSFMEHRKENYFDEHAIEDIPQAFSCFTYRYSRRKLIVCDLQGIYNKSISPPCFELTDPVIHYKSSRRNYVYGRTDKGIEGIQNFFKTHKCSRLCNLVDRRLISDFTLNFE